MKENSFEYVDLGLPSKTMWATCNVGANNQEDDGLLFQFGRVDGYKYGDTNNKFRTNKQNKQYTGCEYTPQTTSGKVYKSGDKLDLKDDAANVNMGSKWKMPTCEQYQEMINNTTHEIIKDKGILFTSKINNQRLFIPFAGYWYNGYSMHMDLSLVYGLHRSIHLLLILRIDFSTILTVIIEMLALIFVLQHFPCVGYLRNNAIQKHSKGILIL